MASTPAGGGIPDAPGKTDRKAQKQQRLAARAKRDAARKEKAAEKGRPERICALPTVDVKKGKDGYTVGINTAGGRKVFTVSSSEAGRVMRDLDVAIQVIRGQE